jgi:hypothetical protein
MQSALLKFILKQLEGEKVSIHRTQEVWEQGLIPQHMTHQRLDCEL